ncbi:MAG: glucosamine-6-phosphate deaminase [Clostridiales bacterium]|nr:glucosamine-6-phosphate deaminase [Clostridiales bacterium]
MKIIITENMGEFNKVAADIVSRQIKNKPDSVLGLATGSTPLGLYAMLIDMYKKGELDFSRVKTFNLDEYRGLPKDHPQSYYHFMYENLFNKINIKDENVNLLNGNRDESYRECADYEEKIKAAGGIDLQVLGIGHNGHIGFNEPGTPFDSVTDLIDLSERTIEANSRFFDSPDQVPRQALSMGIKTIMQSRNIVLLISGNSKARIAAKALNGPITQNVPASVLQLHPFVTVVLDKEAAVYL